MKYFFAFVFVITGTCLPLFGGTALENELTQLLAQHSRAMAAAAEPVNRRQIAVLEMLQRKATQGNDLETAIKIKAELAKLVATSSTTSALVSGADVLANRLIGTKWIFFDKETLTFMADGKAKWSSGRDPWPWSVKNVGLRVIDCENVPQKNKFIITFDRDLKTGTISGEGNTRQTRNITNEP